MAPLLALGFAVPAIALAASGIGPYLRQMSVACDTGTCLSSQLSTRDRELLIQAGIQYTESDAQILVIITSLVAAVALLIAGFGIWRRPYDSAVVWFSIVLTALATQEFIMALAIERPELTAAVVVVRGLYLVGLPIALTLLPDGRFPNAMIRWWCVVAAGLGVIVAANDGSQRSAIIYSTVVAVLALAALVLRYRTSRASQTHEHLVWVGIGLALLAGAQIVGRPLRVLPLPQIETDSALPFIAIVGATSGLVLLVGGLTCLAVAMLHDELIEVELVLNRALVYGVLSTLVISSYVLIVGLLSLIFQARGSLWFTLVATGVIAMLFHPARTQVQRLVNQMLFGSRDAPHAIIARLGHRLEASLPPEAALPTIVEVVANELKLPYVAIAVQHTDGANSVRASVGAPEAGVTTFPLQYHGEPVGLLMATPRTGERTLSATDRRALEDIARQAGIAVHAVRLTDDLRRSRERLVATREEERRRLRRDLHDGLGPTLATITLQSDTAHDLIRSDPAEAEAVLRELSRQSEAMMDQVRHLIHALRPPVLDDLGLPAALRSLATSFGDASTEIVVRTPSSLPPLAAAAEVAIYRIAQEALTNVVRHAGARTCVVELTCDDVVCLEIRDDGIGLSNTRDAGVGLLSMRERAEELGGKCRIGQRDPCGTVVRVEIPRGGSDGSDPGVDRG